MPDARADADPATSNDDICAVLCRLIADDGRLPTLSANDAAPDPLARVAARLATAAAAPSLADFLHDHQHNLSGLQQLLAELDSPRAA